MKTDNYTSFLKPAETQKRNRSLYVLGSGRHHSDLRHEWGPGVKSHYQLHHVMRGRGTYHCRGRQFALGEGDTFLIYPDTSIHYHADETEPWDCIWVGFSGEYADSLIDLTDFSPHEPVYRGKDYDRLRALVEAICNSEGVTLWDRLEMDGNLCALLALLMRSSQKSKQPDRDADCATVAAEYIKTHFEEPISVEQLAAYTSVSHSSLYRRFIKRYNMPPKQFIIACRIERACTLLEETNCSIEEISNSVGFDDPFYFSRVFKEVKGIPPRKFAKQAHKKRNLLVE